MTLRKLDFRLFADLDPTPKKNWLIKDYIGEGELSCLFSPPGGAKSLLAVDMDAAIAANVPWFGRRVTSGAVLYIACERGALVKRRLAAWRADRNITNIPLGVVSDNIDLRSSTADADAIIRCAAELCAQTKQELRKITIDTASRALAGGDENSSKDMGAFVNSIARIQSETGAHVMITHHVPHEQNRMRGHGALLAACDTTISLERSGDVRTATVIKSNDGEEGARVAFKTDDGPELYRDPETNKVTSAGVVREHNAECLDIETDNPRLTPNQQTIFSILHTAGPAGLSTEVWNERAREIGIGTRRAATLHDIRVALVDKGIIRQTTTGWAVNHQ
jgi:hypothetical protein